MWCIPFIVMPRLRLAFFSILTSNVPDVGTMASARKNRAQIRRDAYNMMLASYFLGVPLSKFLYVQMKLSTH